MPEKDKVDVGGQQRSSSCIWKHELSVDVQKAGRDPLRVYREDSEAVLGDLLVPWRLGSSIPVRMGRDHLSAPQHLHPNPRVDRWLIPKAHLALQVSNFPRKGGPLTLQPLGADWRWWKLEEEAACKRFRVSPLLGVPFRGCVHCIGSSHQRSWAYLVKRATWHPIWDVKVPFQLSFLYQRQRRMDERQGAVFLRFIDQAVAMRTIL